MQSPHKVGDIVFVKLPNTRCTTPWIKGEVTNLLSPWKLEIDGIPHHIKDVRSCSNISDNSHEDPQNSIVFDFETSIPTNNKMIIVLKW